MSRLLAFALVIIGSASIAEADHRMTSPGVTMESCSDVDVDELQDAISIEYQGEDDHRTMVTVVCTDSIATVRVLGPSHPRGRIVDVDIAGVDRVALPRMLAVVAAEMWTAPAVENKQVVLGSQAREVVDSASEEGVLYRRRLMMGVGLTSMHRGIQAGRSTGSVGASGSFAALSLQLDWPIWSRLGVFMKSSHSSYVRLNGLEELGEPVRWSQTELGIYVPLVRSRFRLAARAAFGRENYQTQRGVYVDPMIAVLPDYRYDAVGFDLAYQVEKDITLNSRAEALFMSNYDEDFSSPRGYRWGAGLSYDFTSHLRIDGRVEAASVSQINQGTSRAYSDVMTTLRFALQYLR